MIEPMSTATTPTNGLAEIAGAGCLTLPPAGDSAPWMLPAPIGERLSIEVIQ
jgi:hypothetical protein